MSQKGLFCISVLIVSFQVLFIRCKETYKRDVQKRRTKETYKRDLQKTNTKVIVRIDLSTYGSLLYVCFDSLFQSCLFNLKRDVQKRHTNETYKRDIQKTHTKVSFYIDLSTYGSLLYVCLKSLFQSCLFILRRDLQTRHTEDTHKSQCSYRSVHIRVSFVCLF